jgi:uncharacterized protein YdhG (YjbR/CyaY superfamily)
MVQKFTDVDDYLTSLPPDVRTVLQRVRQTIHDAVPGAQETISYNIPTMVRDGRRFLHFAGWAKHVALYPVPDADEDLADELAPYIAGQGTLRFCLDQPIPYPLIGRAAVAATAVGPPPTA